MNQRTASALAFAATAGAIVCTAVIASGKAYAAGDITVDDTVFVSSRTRAEVRAEVLQHPELVTAAANEWVMQHNQASTLASGYTREQARLDYQMAREEVMAITSEDSGSAYFARRRMGKDQTLLAGSAQ